MKNEQLVFRVIEYGMKHQYFTFIELKNALSLNELDESYVWRSLTCSEQFSSQNPNHILVCVKRNTVQGTNRELTAKEHTYSLLSTAVFSYVDYLEIVEARRNAKNAFYISIGAIVISIIIGIAQIYYQATAVG